MIGTAPDTPQAMIVRAASGDPAAARHLVEITGDVVYGFIYARVGGDRDVTEDLLQATYLEAIRAASSFRGDATLETWLCGIARHRVARHFEAERRRARLERKLQVIASEPEPRDDDADLTADADVLIAALGRLTPLHRQVLVLKYLDGSTVERIATELGRTRVQVQSLLQRARSALRRELEATRDE